MGRGQFPRRQTPTKLNQAAPIREDREKEDRADLELILRVYRFCGYDKGARGIRTRMLHLSEPVNNKPQEDPPAYEKVQPMVPCSEDQSL